MIACSFIAIYTQKSKDEDGFVDDALTRVSTRGLRDDDETDDDGGGEVLRVSFKARGRKSNHHHDSGFDETRSADDFERERKRKAVWEGQCFSRESGGRARRRRGRNVVVVRRFGRAEANCRRATRRRHRKAVGGAVGGVTRID